MEQTIDPISALLARDWAALGGWSLFFSLVMLIVIGAFREWWVPGPRFRRQETLLTKSVELNHSLSEQNGKLITANEITKHFFQEVTPVRATAQPGRSDSSEGDDGDPPR